ncbi:MAG: cytochrome-c peroxidase, partial [Chitinophagaceae bacterium]
MKYLFTILLLLGWCITIPLLFDGCKKKEQYYGTALLFSRPPGFPEPTYGFINPPVTEEGFALGRKLFYEGRLSLDGNFACSSCHQQAAAFTTKDHDLGHGYNNAHTRRNPIGLSNLAWFNGYNLDGSAQTLE